MIMPETKLKPCPFCGREIDIKRDVYIPERDWHPTEYDSDSGGEPISLFCQRGFGFSHGYNWGEFVIAWNRRVENV